MEISGLGNNTTALNLQQAPIDIEIPKNSFNQVLSNVVNQSSSKQKTSSNKQNNSGAITAERLLSFLENLAALQLNGGNEQLKSTTSNPNVDLLQMLKNLLGQSNEKGQGIPTDLGKIFNAGGEPLNANVQGKEAGKTNANLLDFNPNGNRLSVWEDLLLNPSLSGQKVGGDTSTNNNTLTLLLNKIKSPGSSTQRSTSSTQNDAADLITLLESSGLLQIKDGNELLSQLESNAKAGSLQTNNVVIGNSRNKSFVNAADAGSNLGSLIEAILTGLLGQKLSQLSIPPANSTNLLKGPALSGALSAAVPVEQKIPTHQAVQAAKSSRLNKIPNLGSVETVKGQLQDNSNLRLKYLDSTFSQAVKEISNSKDNGLKNNDSSLRFSDWNNGNSIVFHQMSKPEQFVLMTQGAKNSASVNNMIQQFESILARSQFSKSGGTQKLLIQIHPENLGSLRIELVQKDQTTVARILTTTAAAKDALEAHLHSLKDAFAAQSIPINKVEIGTQLTQPQENRFSENNQQHSQQQRQEQRKENEKEEDSDSTFILSLDEALLNKKV